MNRFAIYFISALLLCYSALAQQADPAQAREASSAPRFAPGSVIPVELTKSVDAKKAKVGDDVEAKVVQDLKAQNGQVLVPKDTKVVGHVTQVQAHSKEQKESDLGIMFDRAVMKGNNVPIPMSIQAVISPTALGSNNNSTTNAPPPENSPSSGTSAGSPGGRNPGMSSGQPSTVSPSTAGGEAPATTRSPGAPHEPVNADTQGVVGMSNLKLSPTADPKTGSVLSSEKGNVKLDSGTFMLLRVSQ